ncbi:MAG: aspartate kinase [Oscillospiraceae bacterium]|jgi:aspartate kinase|nr:aspartate kinase [Oscillospiraceae bacterium]
MPNTQIIITEGQSIVTFNNVSASYQSAFIRDVFAEAAEAGINIDMIAQSPATSDKISFGFTFSDDDMPKLLTIINSRGGDRAHPLINCGNVKITVKSRDMVTSTGFASRVFDVLRKSDCLPLLVTTGLDEISLLVYESAHADLERELKGVFAS